MRWSGTDITARDQLFLDIMVTGATQLLIVTRVGTEGRYPPESILSAMVLMLEDRVEFKVQACLHLFLVLQHSLERQENELPFTPCGGLGGLLLRKMVTFQDALVRVRY